MQLTAWVNACSRRIFRRADEHRRTSGTACGRRWTVHRPRSGTAGRAPCDLRFRPWSSPPPAPGAQPPLAPRPGPGPGPGPWPRGLRPPRRCPRPLRSRLIRSRPVRVRLIPFRRPPYPCRPPLRRCLPRRSHRSLSPGRWCPRAGCGRAGSPPSRFVPMVGSTEADSDHSIRVTPASRSGTPGRAMICFSTGPPTGTPPRARPVPDGGLPCSGESVHGAEATWPPAALTSRRVSIPMMSAIRLVSVVRLTPRIGLARRPVRPRRVVRG